MSCILRVSGIDLDIDKMLSVVALVPDRVWRRGEVRGTLSGKLHGDSGASFVASGADFEQGRVQVAEATQFLELHFRDLGQMASFPGVEEITLDFGIALLQDAVAVFTYFPPAIVQLAASVGVGLAVSHYARGEPSGSGA